MGLYRELYQLSLLGGQIIEWLVEIVAVVMLIENNTVFFSG